MNTIQINLSLALHLETPLLVASDFARGRISKLAVRDDIGHPIVPATTLKGRLRYYVQQFASILQRFQTQLPKDIDDQLMGCADRAGQLYFADAVFPLQRVERRSGIKINRMLGSVEEAHLRTIETCPAYQVLTTQIEGYLEGGEDGHALGHLLGGLRLFDKLGAGKSSGLGRVYFEVTELKTRHGQKERSPDPQKLLETYIRRQLAEVQS